MVVPLRIEEHDGIGYARNIAKGDPGIVSLWPRMPCIGNFPRQSHPLSNVWLDQSVNLSGCRIFIEPAQRSFGSLDGNLGKAGNERYMLESFG